MDARTLLQKRWVKITLGLFVLLLMVRGCNLMLGPNTPEEMIRAYLNGYMRVFAKPPYSAQFRGFDAPVKKTDFGGSEYTETTARLNVGKDGYITDMSIVFQIYRNGDIYAVHEDGKRVRVQ